MYAGKVILLGAGPGDLELLTIKALKALQAADVLLLDDLVNPQIKDLAPQAEIVSVGKRSGQLSTPQHVILQLMKFCAQQGQIVVRVKGGEGLIFGRAGEEIDYLRKNGINVEIVNGISAGMAAAASLSVSLTHRDYCQGVTFVTAHLRDHSEPDWAALAATGTTLVIYMGMSRLTTIRRSLLEHYPATMPAAIVESASTSRERRVLTTLGDLDQAAKGMGGPAVILIGWALMSGVSAPRLEPENTQADPLIQMAPAYC